MRSSFIITILAALMIIGGCRKEGPGGKSSVSGKVLHHDLIIPNCTVYIKYDATEFPGNDVSKYDASVTADADANYEFKGLRKGNYYLYGVGYDASIGEIVRGGVSVKLKYNQDKNSNVPVTE